MSERVIAEVGGGVDEVRVALGIYRRDLEPAAITALLGCEPTRSHRRDDAPMRGPAFEQGAWILSIDGKAPVGPDELVRQLLARLPSTPAVWAELRATCQLHLSVALFVDAWNRGFELALETSCQLVERGIPIGFSVYVD
ncbi:MAG TPA: DUF4279 domain-containing protein [Kofleriaceae bacterium]